jgi:UDP-N-acetylmuramyl pentapeptide phosphotransferase/UDP-N-acetylglucosamine-1-phosphate transferase
VGVLFAFVLIGFVTTVILLYLYLKLSYKFHWFDEPDEERKSHTIVKPTSAGIAFMLPIVLFTVFMPHVSLISSPLLIIALTLLIVIGAYDDFRNLSIKLRLVIISLVSITVIALFFDIEISNIVLMLVYFLGVVWWMNLFNFMDGADGMAVLHALIALVGYTLYFILFSNMEYMYLRYLLFAIACLFSFLLFNFPQAKMFMGDSGSLSLSFFIAVIALYGISQGIFDEFVVIAFHLVFIVDATLTLLVRIKFKQSMTQAHNLHLYQALIQSGKSHANISLCYAFTSFVITTITLFLRYMKVNQAVMFMVLVGEAIILSIYWFNFHNKTKFERFIR